MGSNLGSAEGDPTETVRFAIQLMREFGLVIREVSRFYQTPAFPPGSGADYVNAAVSLDACGTPQEIMQTLHDIEATLGRERRGRWTQRTIDLDLIGMGDIVLPDAATHAKWREMPLEQQMQEAPDQLILPHPRVQDRGFVLVPLADIAPHWMHPVLGLSVTQMRDALPDAALQEVKTLQ